MEKINLGIKKVDLLLDASIILRNLETNVIQKNVNQNFLH